MSTVIIGFGSAGYAALMSLKRINPREEITVIDPKEYDLMHPCGLPYALEGVVEADHICQNIHLDRMGVKKVMARALRIERDRNVIRALAAGVEIDVEFSRALIALGSRPVVPPVKNAGALLGKGLFTLTTAEDLARISGRVKGARAAVVIGAGAIGLEAAVALREHLDNVTVVEMKEQVLPGVLDEDMARLVQEHLEERGIMLRLGTVVEEILGGDALEGVGIPGERIPADLGILAAGFLAETGLAEESGLKYGPLGIMTDRYLRTSRGDVYAAGDCLSGWSVLDGRELAAKLATSAYKQGTLAGINMAGGNEEYRGSAGTFVTRIGRLEAAGTGYNTAAARAAGYDPQPGKIKSALLPEYFPDNPGITVKILADRSSGKILGAQAVGEKGAADRINLISMALEFGIPLADMTRVEMAYCPAVSEVYDPLLRAVDFGLRRMKR